MVFMASNKDDKFIMMNLDDARSKKVAEAISNPTCKKILDYLAENNEKSEEDISNELGIPINTVEYNLKKLLEAGLIDKTKNFFWSKRGKKINLYKLANKHIVISPKSKRPDINLLKTIIPVIIAVAIVAILLILLSRPQPVEQEFNTFNSIQEIKDFLKENKVESGRYGEGLDFATKAATTSGAAPEASGAQDYSETNIQVAGVDEADIIKNDGKYIYVVSGNKVVIVDAYPAGDMEILSEINLSDSVGEIFINEDKLIVFTRESSPVLYKEARCAGKCPMNDEILTNVHIYDISDREDPLLEHEILVSGNYVNSRMIDDFVYVITNQYIYEEPILPVVIEDGSADIIEADEISYVPIKDYSFQYTIILAVDIDNGETSEETMLTGATQNIYVSKDNIYTSYTKYQAWYTDLVEPEKTIINKISINNHNIKHVGTGEVPGHILNQFSMDEYNRNFRIATTLGEVWGTLKSQNNVYVLDENMQVTGKLEGLAPGEKIYSVRFMGDRGYVVTFKKIDPLFVIDLSNPEKPDVLGKLKIPGYSDYLHPYDENHIIGIGKETVEAEDALIEQRQLDFAWYQGVKIAIFDVSDVENPIELHKVVIGDRGTDSEALSNHKAFLFDKEKELLVIPITLAEIQGEKSYDNQYGEYTFQGAYVYNINLEDGFDLKGRITHYEDDEVFKKSGYYFYGNRNVQRSLYMDDFLYTFSTELIKANDLNDLNEINSVDLPYEQPDYPVMYDEGLRGV